MKRKSIFFGIVLLFHCGFRAESQPRLLLRVDDNGMNHSVNMAIKQVAETGIPFSTSVMFACPWYQEAVAVLTKFPRVSVGVHLVLNSEWKYYRWGPVLGRTAVPSLVDSEGYFLASTDEFLNSNYKLDEVEKELEAQIERALHSGLKIDYVDYHMWTAISTPELRAIVEKLAKKYRLGISRYFGENYQSMFDVSVETKKDEFFKRIKDLQKRNVNLLVMHVAQDTPEMQALIDMNDAGMHSETKPLVAMHRSTELNILLSQKFQEMVKNGAVQLVTYKDLVQSVGLDRMKAPEDQSDVSALPWSREPPAGLKPKDIPQFVSITFDDNFGLANSAAVGGMNYITEFYKNKRNPAGSGNPENFDGSPIKTTFYHTSIYVVDETQKVLGGKNGEDHLGRIRKAWSKAVEHRHETAVHTVNHFNGGVVQLDPDDCCRPRNWNEEEWAAEIKSCKDTLTGPDGIGAKTDEVIGFRAPYLGYNDNLFSALRNLNFTYDTTLPNCFDDAEDGTNCSWPYTLDQGSPDVEVLARKFPVFKFPKVTSHPGLWEIPPTTLIVPPDTVASKYGFTAGLRDRIAKKEPLPYPSLFEASTGKITGLDYTLLIDAVLTGAEMSAVLKYNLDLHIAGNRSPLVFIAHSHLYTYSTPQDNPGTPTAADRDTRWKGLTDFITYALTKPEVRIVSAKDLLMWVQKAASRSTR